MNETTAKFRLKIGLLEVEYEGSETFLRDDLSDLVDTVSNLFNDHPAAQTNHIEPSSSELRPSAPLEPNVDFSTSTIASRMSANSGSDLAAAASIRLALVDKKERFTRAEILTAMKEATGHYKTTMASNLSASLKRLVRNKRLNETGSGSYALTATERQKAERLLA